MQTDRNSLARSLTWLVATASIASLAQATAGADLRGQWVGNSQVDGAHSVSRTTLTLGAPDAEDSSLRIEGNTSCLLSHGKYAAGSGDAWSLTFKEGRGGDACERMARGTYTVHPGSKPRSLEFEATYPNSDGGQNQRRGALSRYP